MARMITGAGIQTIVELRQYITDNHYGIKKLERLYAVEPMSDYITQDAVQGGYVPNEKNLQKNRKRKELHFVYG